jgi:4-aminobutyrate aminotransferase
MPFPFWHQHGLPPSTPTSTLVSQSLYQLELLLAQQTSPRDTAAIIIEPVLGEGGYVPAPSEFLHGLRDVCDKHGILLIIDEVQSGFGRTGKNFNIEYSGVKPDILIMAKVLLLTISLLSSPLTLHKTQGLANGFPLSGVVSRKELTDHLTPGSMVCVSTQLPRSTYKPNVGRNLCRKCCCLRSCRRCRRRHEGRKHP